MLIVRTMAKPENSAPATKNGGKMVSCQPGTMAKPALALLHIPPAALVTPREATRAFAAAATPVALQIAPSSQVLWTSHGQALLVADSNALIRIDAVTGEQSAALTVPISTPKGPGLDAIAQGVDGKTLLLAFGYTPLLTALRAAPAPRTARIQIPAPASCAGCPGLPVGIYQYQYSAV